MTCRSIRELRAQQPDDPDDQQLISRHVQECPMCLDELGQLPAALAAPKSAIPPPNFAASLMAKLPATPALAATQARSRALRQRVLWGVVLGFVTLIVLWGGYGVLFDSSLPAATFGGVDSSAGRGVMALTLAGKPMAATLGLIGIPLLLGVLVLAGAALMIWRRLLTPSPALLVEVEQ
ncbi:MULTISPECIES: hypothetical protein [Herpetosiphon]|uniref:hypothetical protein n=1 Tax=Herpetosiphon TaxID=64 RepID=UPI00195A5D3D|nr:hypothetical protein [Herpetosiphon giganteus]MBM7843224.1 hypothetical protein [Herpetosiphon giganteus]